MDVALGPGKGKKKSTLPVIVIAVENWIHCINICAISNYLHMRPKIIRRSKWENFLKYEDFHTLNLHTVDLGKHVIWR